MGQPEPQRWGKARAVVTTTAIRVPLLNYRFHRSNPGRDRSQTSASLPSFLANLRDEMEVSIRQLTGLLVETCTRR